MPGSGFSVFNLATSGVADITFSADGTRLYVSTTSGQVKVYDVATRALLHTWNIGTQLGAISLSEDGAWLLATERNIGSSGTSILYRIDAATGASTPFTRPGAAFNDVEAVTNGLALVTGASGGITTFNIATGSFGSVNGFSGARTLTESGRYTLIGDFGISPGSFAVYNDITNLVSPAPFNVSGGVSWGVQAVSEPLGRMALFSYYNTIVITDLSFQLVTSITAAGPVIGMNFSADGSLFYYYQVDSGTVVIKETTGWTTIETLTVAPGSWTNNFNTGNELIVSPNGYYFAVRDSQTGDLNLVDLTQRNESFAGTAGADNMAGGPGDDIYFVNLPGDIVTENPFEGNDTVYSSASSYVLSANIERLVLESGATGGTGNAGNNVITGNAGFNQLSGMDGNDILIGDAGDDVLFGGNGIDNLNGGLGADIMTGGAGDDVFIADTIDDLVFENAGEGNDVVYTSGNYTLRGGVAVEVLLTDAPSATTAINLSGNEFNNAITGNAGSNILLGNAGNDALIGLDGNDTLDGGAGIDTANGGLGDDVYIVDSADDVVLEAAGQGRDLLFTSASFALRAGDSIELLLTDNQAGTAAINLSGNEIDNIIQGNQGSNILSGGAGSDVLLGYGGDDFLNGGIGADITTGGLGDDIYFVDALDDIVLENVGEGRDIIYATSNYILRQGISVEFLIADPQSSIAAINLTGNEIANTIQGNAGSNILFGGGGDDTILGNAGNDNINGNSGNDAMIGGVGDDIYFVDSTGDVVSELTGEGRDTIYASVNFALGSSDNVEVMIADPAIGAVAINLTGNGIANTLQGNAANNVLTGGGGDDLLLGYNGNDTLNGGAGADVMSGGFGDDIYWVDSVQDQIIEEAGQGNDLVVAFVDYVLPTGLSVELLYGDGGSFLPLNLTGNELANNIQGTQGSNTLVGGAGDDTIFALSGNDLIDGGSGNDSMSGGLGDDTFVVDSALDVVNEASGQGIDTILYSSSNYTLAAGVSVEFLRPALGANLVAASVTGNELDNAITGNAAANQLSGGAGNDTLSGMDGADTLTGGSGADIFFFGSPASASNADTIVDFVGGLDRIGLSTAAFGTLSAGNLAASAFVVGTAALDADDRIIYDQATGKLYYDADGNGAGAAVQIATLTGAPTLTASDFIIG